MSLGLLFRQAARNINQDPYDEPPKLLEKKQVTQTSPKRSKTKPLIKNSIINYDKGKFSSPVIVPKKPTHLFFNFESWQEPPDRKGLLYTIGNSQKVKILHKYLNPRRIRNKSMCQGRYSVDVDAVKKKWEDDERERRKIFRENQEAIEKEEQMKALEEIERTKAERDRQTVETEEIHENTIKEKSEENSEETPLKESSGLDFNEQSAMLAKRISTVNMVKLSDFDLTGHEISESTKVRIEAGENASVHTPQSSVSEFNDNKVYKMDPSIWGKGIVQMIGDSSRKIHMNSEDRNQEEEGERTSERFNEDNLATNSEFTSGKQTIRKQEFEEFEKRTKYSSTGVNTPVISNTDVRVNSIQVPQSEIITSEKGIANQAKPNVFVKRINTLNSCLRKGNRSEGSGERSGSALSPNPKKSKLTFYECTNSNIINEQKKILLNKSASSGEIMQSNEDKCKKTSLPSTFTRFLTRIDKKPFVPISFDPLKKERNFIDPISRTSSQNLYKSSSSPDCGSKFYLTAKAKIDFQKKKQSICMNNFYKTFSSFNKTNPYSRPGAINNSTSNINMANQKSSFVINDGIMQHAWTPIKSGGSHDNIDLRHQSNKTFEFRNYRNMPTNIASQSTMMNMKKIEDVPKPTMFTRKFSKRNSIISSFNDGGKFERVDCVEDGKKIDTGKGKKNVSKGQKIAHNSISELKKIIFIDRNDNMSYEQLNKRYRGNLSGYFDIKIDDDVVDDEKEE